MFTKRKAGRGVTALLLAIPLVYAAAGGAAADAAPLQAVTVASTGPTVKTPSPSVTLVTGDQVALTADGQVSVQHVPGRQGIEYVSFQEHGDVYVIPSDAESMVFTGQMDMELFDVTRLLAYGASTQTESTPLIVQYATGKSARAAVSSAASAITGSAAGGAKVARDLAVVHGQAIMSPRRTANDFWKTLTVVSGHARKLRAGIRKVWLDQVLKVSDQNSDIQVGAPTAWNAGFNGAGETVAVLDSGIDSTHPDLQGKVVAADNFTTEPNTDDMAGHGTHVASIIAGTGAASGGVQKGVAPGADLINAKACIGNGSCDESAIIAAADWAVQTEGAKLVNMSLGGAATPGADDPLDQMVNSLSSQFGTLFVIAAGNNGPSSQSVSTPGDANSALTVGAVDSSDNIASFSGRGPRLGDEAMKPDITAPGVNITGACSSTGTFCSPGQTYVQLSGTSMATPHVAGAAAIMLEAHPTWTGVQLKEALMGSADPNPSLDTFTQGAGRLNIGRGYAQSVLANPPSVSLGLQDQPRAQDPTLTPSVTYTNETNSSVTLQLALNMTGPGGSTPPAGMFSLSATSVNVPANGSASVTLTANTTISGSFGFYTGNITATSGSSRVVTPIGDDQEAPSVPLTITNIDRNGGAPNTFLDLIQSQDGSKTFVIFNPVQAPPEESATINVPEGNYTIFTSISDINAQGTLSTTNQPLPNIDLTSATTITADSRNAGPVNVSVPDSKAATWYNEVTSLYDPADNGYPTGTTGYPWLGTVAFGAGNLFVGQLGPPNTFVFGFTTKITSLQFDPGPNGDVGSSPHLYHLGWFLDQHLPSGVTENETASNLATATANYAGEEASTTGQTQAAPEPSQHMFPVGIDTNAFFAEPATVGLPFTQQVSYNTDAGVRWYTTFSEQDSSSNTIVSLLGSLIAYTGGNNSYQQHWNSPVYGSAFTSIVTPLNWVVRSGNQIFADVPLAGDSGGNAGHYGDATIAAGNITLKENGSTIGSENFGGKVQYQVPVFNVPSAFGSYELDASVQRTSAIPLSTSVTDAWTFTSATVNNSILPLQMWGVTFSPSLTADTAPANTSFHIPMTVAAQPSSAAAGINTVSLSYSTDDGNTWQSASVSGNPQTGAYTATVQHPNITGFVSLRVNVTDFAGNTFTETIIRAYKIAPGA